MPNFQHDGITFHYRDTGQGVPFVFQPGLGGDANQTFGLFAPPPSYPVSGANLKIGRSSAPRARNAGIHPVLFAATPSPLEALLCID
jgi:hypothetical protein